MTTFGVRRLELQYFENTENPFDLLSPDIQNQFTSIFKKKKYDLHKIHFRDLDKYLDKNLNPPYWLKQPGIAELNRKALHHYDANRYDLLSYCIMPNHVHVLFKLLPNAPLLETVMKNLKSYTGKEGNRILGRTNKGRFWEEESFDHCLRLNEFEKVVKYILNNPVNAKFVKHWKEWKWSYLKEGLKVHW